MLKRFLFILFIVGISSCAILPNEKNAKAFPQTIINSDTTQPVFQFISSADTTSAIKAIRLENKNIDATAVSLNEFVKLHQTISFLIIRNDTILYQYYKPGWSSQRRVTSFSIAKAYVAMLIGIAIQEGKIKSVNDPVTNYITEWQNKPGANAITLKHLLQHTSGLAFSKAITNPLSDQVKYYYGKNLRERALDCDVKFPPGTGFDYQSENPMLLAIILERVTGVSISKYLEEKIWKKIGTEAPANWALDEQAKRSDAIEKAFCCLNAHTLDFARFGRLLLRKGNWEGNQIIPENWINEAITPSLKNGGKQTYGYNMGTGPQMYGSYFPIGLYGQFLYCYPKKNILIVRFGNEDLSYQPNYWKSIMLQLIDQL